MLQLDVLSSFAICGAGAALGLTLMRDAVAIDDGTLESLRLSRIAFALIGASLLQPLATGSPPPVWSQALMGFGTVAALIIIAWAAAALAGERLSRAPMWAGVVLAGVAVLAAWPLGTPGLVWFTAWGLAIGASLMAWMGRRFILRPRDLNERMLGLLYAGTLPTYWLRAIYTLTWDAPYPDHLLHMPGPLKTPYALMYGVLPILYALLLFNVIHARLQARLHLRAITDPLTGALSRHALAETASAKLAQQRRAGQQPAVVIVDLDHFKQVNDRHGHAGGDIVLREVAQLLRAQLRPEALVVRYGGEEFVALVPVEDLPVARKVAERLREQIEATRWHDLVPGMQKLTASIGVTMLGADESLEHALARADEALYRAKNSGRNQVQVGLAAA
jgi:diguanylate cyclase (GGDEF)-like protein